MPAARASFESAALLAAGRCDLDLDDLGPGGRRRVGARVVAVAARDTRRRAGAVVREATQRQARLAGRGARTIREVAEIRRRDLVRAHARAADVVAREDVAVVR